MTADLDRWREIAEPYAITRMTLAGAPLETVLSLDGAVAAIAEAVAEQDARIDRADAIILQLTMHHHSDPDYVKGYDQAQEYFSDYPPKESPK